MLTDLRRAGLIWPTLLAVPAVLVLIGLGAWQWQRKAWKEELLARLHVETAAAAVRLDQLLPYREADTIRLRKTTLRGVYEHDRELHVWTPREGRDTWRVITPVRLTRPVPWNGDGRSITHVLVIRGVVAADHKAAQSRPAGQIKNDQEVSGRIRFASDNWATPAPDLATNRWYALQPDAMARSLYPADVARTVAPFLVEAAKPVAPPPAPQPDFQQLNLNNRHLEYALTWWGLALTLVAVYTAFARGRLRAQSERL